MTSAHLDSPVLRSEELPPFSSPLQPCWMPCSGSGDARRRCGAEGRAGSGHEGSPVSLEDKEEVSCGDETELQRAVQVGMTILIIACI